METPALAAFEQSEERCLVPLRRNRARAPLEESISGEFNYIQLNEDDFPDGKFVICTSLTERGLVVHRSLCSAKQVPAGLGLVQDDFPDEKFVLRPYPVSCSGPRSALT